MPQEHLFRVFRTVNFISKGPCIDSMIRMRMFQKIPMKQGRFAGFLIVSGVAKSSTRIPYYIQITALSEWNEIV